MGDKPTTDLPHAAFPPLLLCVPGDAELNARLLSDNHCGMPLLFHQIQHYHAVGVRKILLATDTVPGALLALADDLKGHNIQVAIVRGADEILAASGDQQWLLVAKAENWFSGDLIRSVTDKQRNAIATVEEHANNGAYERIDLNSRWAGLALLDRSILETVREIPQGWDLGSSLLRQAMQRQATMVHIGQPDVMAGRLAHLASVANPATIFETSSTTVGALETFIFNNLTGRVAKLSWHSPAAHQIALYMFPLLATLSAGLAFLHQNQFSAVAAMLGILAHDIRRFVLAAEYRKRPFDPVAIVAWGLLAVALAVALFGQNEPPLDAFFLTALLVGLAGISRKFRAAHWLSPLVLAACLCAGSIFMVLGLAAKTLIILQLAILCFKARVETAQP